MKRDRGIEAIRKRLEAARAWVESPPAWNVPTDAKRVALTKGQDLIALLAEASAVTGQDFAARAEGLLVEIDLLWLRDQLEWATALTDSYRDLAPTNLRGEAAALLAEAMSGAPGPDIKARAANVLRDSAGLWSRVRWEGIMVRVRRRQGEFPPGEDIAAGWEHLRDAFGDRLWSSFLAGFLCNTIKGHVIAHGRLGLLLRDSSGKPGYAKLVDRLLDDEPAVRGLLAEFGILWTLRARGAMADMLLALGKETGESTCADIRVSQPSSFEIEVSYLGDPSTLTAAWDLRRRLERGVLSAISNHDPLLVCVQCSGRADNLLRHVSVACDQLAQRISAVRPWMEELAPGLVFEVADGSVTHDVRVTGATVQSGDPSANENPLRRLPAKVEEESRQVPDGGVVLICTSQLAVHAAQAATADEAAFAGYLYESLAEAFRDTGTRMTNVAAFAVLDSIDGTAGPIAPTMNLGPGATLHEADDSLGHQRLLWVANPRASRPLGAQAKALLRLPLGIYP